MMSKQELLQKHGAGAKKAENISYDGKLIVQMQICIRCGRTFPFKKGRKSCPYCQATLRTRAMVLKAP